MAFDAKKTRLSVPSAFRAVLAQTGDQDIVLRPSNHSPCIDVWPKAVFQAEVERRTKDLDPFSEEFDAVTDGLTVKAFDTRVDADGRVVLPRALLADVPLDARCYVAEFVGTTILVLVGPGAAMVAARTHAFGHAGVALAFGLVVTLLVAAFGATSGAHLNPAVTLAFWSAGRFPGRAVAPYVAAQVDALRSFSIAAGQTRDHWGFAWAPRNGSGASAADFGTTPSSASASVACASISNQMR